MAHTPPEIRIHVRATFEVDQRAAAAILSEFMDWYEDNYDTALHDRAPVIEEFLAWLDRDPDKHARPEIHATGP